MLDTPDVPAIQLADVEVEQAILSAILSDAKTMDRVGELQPEDFADPVRGEMFAAMLNLKAERLPINTINLRAKAGLSAMGREAIMDQLRALSFAGEIPNVADMSRQMIDFSCRRTLLDLHRRYQHAATDSSQTIEAQLSSLRVEMDTVASRLSSQGKTRLTHKQATDKMLEGLSRNLADVLVPCGIKSIDGALAGGFRRGDYAILAGRPGAGKSSLALSIALGAAKGGYGICYFTLEMTIDQLMLRATSAMASKRNFPIHYERIEAKQLTQPEEEHFYRVAMDMPTLPIYYDGAANLLASEIQARTKQARLDFQEAGHTLDMVIVDHMGKVRPTNRYKGNKVQEVGEISNAMALLAKEENVAVVSLQQLNRAVESRENKRPQLADLRNSGDIEQDADVVMFPYREAYYLSMKPEDEGTEKEMQRQTQLRAVEKDLELLIAKNRRGRISVAKLYCDIGCNLIEDV